jgi:D-beta-D-heptose 7-phosphate kinase/D-beta-D-heptose 1-phosphate adenosyltransferase
MNGKKKSLTHSLDNLKEKRVLVVGDIILDVTCTTRALGLSLETPTIKTEEIKTVCDFGGAANVVKNILSLGSSCTFLSVCGSGKGREELSKWSHPKLKKVFIEDMSRKNTVKQRFWVERGGTSYKYFQVNSTENSDLTKNVEEKLRGTFVREINHADIVLIIDYNMGCLRNKSLVQFFIQHSKRKTKDIVCASQISSEKISYEKFKGSSLVCLNLDEAREELASFQPTIQKIKMLRQKIGCKNICVTRGSNGTSLLLGSELYDQPSIKVNSIDSCGAGDAFLSCLSLCDYQKNPRNSLIVSNAWAGLSTEITGTGCPEKDKLISLMEDTEEEL